MSGATLAAGSQDMESDHKGASAASTGKDSLLGKHLVSADLAQCENLATASERQQQRWSPKAAGGHWGPEFGIQPQIQHEERVEAADQVHELDGEAVPAAAAAIVQAEQTAQQDGICADSSQKASLPNTLQLPPSLLFYDHEWAAQVRPHLLTFSSYELEPYQAQHLNSSHM